MHVPIARWRLRSQYLVAPHARSVGAVLEKLLAVQAENPSQSAWAVASRTAHPEPGALAALLASGEVVRTHVLRSTWHYVARDDIDWLLALTGPRLVTLVEGQLLGGGLTPQDVERLTSAVLALLADTPNRTREEVVAVLQRVPELGQRVTGQVAMLLMALLELRRLVVSGPPRPNGRGHPGGAEHTYALYAGRVGSRVEDGDLDRDAALAQLALRYFTGHGPATLKDLAYWATVTVPEARRGLDAVRDGLASFEHDGRAFWHAPGVPPDAPGEPGGHLLQLLDEVYRGYQDSRWVLDASGIVPRQRESAIGIALVDGQLVAGMKRRLTASQVQFDLIPHRALSAAERQALSEAAARYGEFLGLPAVLRG